MPVVTTRFGGEITVLLTEDRFDEIHLSVIKKTPEIIKEEILFLQSYIEIHFCNKSEEAKRF